MDKVNAYIGGICLDASQISTTYKTVILKPNVVDGVNVASQQDFAEPNTKYVIRWDYDLQGGTIVFPPNCLIQFDGGSLSNGTIVGDNTTIISYQENSEILKNVTTEGTFLYTKYNREQVEGALSEIREYVNGAFDLTVSESDLSIGPRQKPVERYKKITITDGKENSVSFNAVVVDVVDVSSYRVIFYPQGGTFVGSGYNMVSGGDYYYIDVDQGESIALPQATMSNVNFAGWNTTQNAAVNAASNKQGGQSFTPNSDITLYAQWQCTVTVYKGENTSAQSQVTTVKKDGSFTFPALPSHSYNTEHQYNITKNCWTDSQNHEYNPGASVTIEENIYFYQKIEKTLKTYSVVFAADGASNLSVSSATATLSGSTTSLSVQSVQNSELQGGGKAIGRSQATAPWTNQIKYGSSVSATTTGSKDDVSLTGWKANHQSANAIQVNSNNRCTFTLNSAFITNSTQSNDSIVLYPQWTAGTVTMYSYYTQRSNNYQDPSGIRTNLTKGTSINVGDLDATEYHYIVSSQQIVITRKEFGKEGDIAIGSSTYDSTNNVYVYAIESVNLDYEELKYN